MRELMLQTGVEANVEYLPTVKEITEPIKQEDVIRKKIDELKSMGFTQVAKKAESAHKMTIAYGQFMFISQETVEKFNQKLKKETLQEDKRAYHYKKLIFIPIEKYQQVPPTHVLEVLSKTKKLGIFDQFEIGKIDWIEEIKDPIVFGRIDGCNDRFYIAQWDNDVRIEDLLRI